MNNLKPHVYFAEFNGEYYLSVLTKLPAGKKLSRTPKFEPNGNVLKVTFSVNSRNGRGNTWICRRAFSNAQIKKFETIKLIIEGGGSIDLFRGAANEEDNDFMVHDDLNIKTLFKDYPHLFSEKNGNTLSTSVFQKSRHNIKFNFNRQEVISSPQGKTNGYSTYSEEATVQGEKIRISAEDQDGNVQGRRRRPRRKKAKLRHSY